MRQANIKPRNYLAKLLYAFVVAWILILWNHNHSYGIGHYQIILSLVARTNIWPGLLAYVVLHTNSLKCRMSNKSSSEWAAWPAVCFKLKQEMALSRGTHSLAPGLAQVVLNGFNKRQAEQLQRKEDHSQLLFYQSIGWLAGIYDGLDYGKVAKITKIGTLHHLYFQQ